MKGVLNLVSVGPGFADLIVPRAEEALRDSDVIVAYELYLRWIEPWIKDKEIHTPPLTHERERALLAIEKARSGAKVALISSGDIGIYAMAALAFDEMREDDEYDVNVIPGITFTENVRALYERDIARARVEATQKKDTFLTVRRWTVGGHLAAALIGVAWWIALGFLSRKPNPN